MPATGIAAAAAAAGGMPAMGTAAATLSGAGGMPATIAAGDMPGGTFTGPVAFSGAVTFTGQVTIINAVNYSTSSQGGMSASSSSAQAINQHPVD